MRSITRFTTVVMLFTFVFSAKAEVKVIPTKSKVSHVTLYRSQALVTREISVPNDIGELALLIDDLPPSIVPGSLFASSKELKVRSVRYLTELIPRKLSTDKISQLERKIEDLNVEKETIAVKLKLLLTKKDYLANVEKKYIAKLGPERSAVSDKRVEISGFDFASISKMTEFIFKQQETITDETLKLDDESRKIAASIKKIQQELAALRHDETTAQQQKAEIDKNIIHKAIVYVANLKPARSTLSLNYLVNNAGWNPAYNMRITEKGDSLNVEYLAHVRQLTGEDWNGVNLILSTATPNMNAEIPILAPMWVRLIDSAKSNASGFSLAKSNLLVQNAKSQIGTIAQYQQQCVQDVMDYNIALNSGAWNRQELEFQTNKKVLNRWKEGVRKIEQQMAVEYIIPDTVTLASRNDNQMVQIFSDLLSCSLYYEAVPLLSGYVSRGVESKNTIKQPLLAGRYSAFIEGQYVGSGQVPITATGQTLQLGFGIDPQLRCRRELMDKIADKSWGSRTEAYKYSLILDNYKSSPVDIRLLDRIPVTKDKGLEIILKEGKDKLCKNEDYREFELPKGILRWDITLPPSSSGSKATKFDYSFDMRFDSDMRISGFDNQMQQKLRDELFELKRRKQRK